eukprot:872207-Rhodomonas_salina.1
MALKCPEMQYRFKLFYNALRCPLGKFVAFRYLRILANHKFESCPSLPETLWVQKQKVDVTLTWDATEFKTLTDGLLFQIDGSRRELEIRLPA